MNYQAIVIGAGLSGAVMAERMASQLGWKVLVLEQRNHIGGNCFDEYDEYGVLVHRYGPHLFHTDNHEVWGYLSAFTEWLPYEHRVLSRIDGQLVPIPFNLTSIERCFPADKAGAMIEALRTRFGDGARVPILELRKEQDPLLGELADFIYQKAFVNYTSKQWGVPPEQISPEVTARVPVVVSRDDRYFTDPWQAVPAAGYTAMFERMLAHQLIDVRLSTPMAQHVKLDWQHKQVLLDGAPFDGPLIYTGMLIICCRQRGIACHIAHCVLSIGIWRRNNFNLSPPSTIRMKKPSRGSPSSSISAGKCIPVQHRLRISL